VERVDLTWQHGVDRQRRWRNGATAHWQYESVTFGRLGDGRWFTSHTNDPDGAYAFDADERGKELALRLAYRIMGESGGRWMPTPAAYDSAGRPTDGLPWVKAGGEWILADG
jgi:hypothetical protein